MGFIIVILFIGAILLFFSYANISKEEVRTNLSGSNRMKYSKYAKYLENFVMNGVRQSKFKLIKDNNKILLYEMDFYDKQNVYNGKLELALIDDIKPYLRGNYIHFYGAKWKSMPLNEIIIDIDEIDNEEYINVLLEKVLLGVEATKYTMLLMGYK